MTSLSWPGGEKKSISKSVVLARRALGGGGRGRLTLNRVVVWIDWSHIEGLPLTTLTRMVAMKIQEYWSGRV